MENAFRLHGSTPHTLATGDEGDISNLCQYGWYEWCYFRDQTAAFPNNKEVLGRVLGPARGAGNEMAQWILKANGRVVPRRSLRPLKVDEIHSPVEIKKREVFDEFIKRRWGTPMTPPNTQHPKAFKKYEDHEQQEQPTLEVEDIVDSTGKLINQQPAYDQIINAEVQLQLGEEMVTGKVIQTTIGPDGQVTGTYDNNPFLRTPMTPPNTQHPKAFEKYEDHEQQEQPTLEVEDIVDSTGKLINQQPAYDQIINAEVQLRLGEEMVTGKVIQRTIGPDGQVTGTYDNDPFLNSIIYDVEFPDGQVKEYATNIIAENMLTQVDSDGMSTTLMEAIVDH